MTSGVSPLRLSAMRTRYVASERQKEKSFTFASLTSLMARLVPAMTSCRLFFGSARIGVQSRSLDTGDGDDFVVVGCVAGNADGAEDLIVRIADQHAAGIRHQPPLARRHDGGEEVRVLRRALHHGA